MDISCSCGHLFPLVLTLAVISAAKIKTPVNHQVELASFGRNSQNSSLQTGISHSTPPKMCSTGTLNSAGRSSLTSCHYLDRSPHLRTSLPRPTPYIVNGREVSTNVPILTLPHVVIIPANEPSAKFSQSLRRPYQSVQPIPYDLCVGIAISRLPTYRV